MKKEIEVERRVNKIPRDISDLNWGLGLGAIFSFLSCSFLALVAGNPLLFLVYILIATLVILILTSITGYKKEVKWFIKK